MLLLQPPLRLPLMSYLHQEGAYLSRQPFAGLMSCPRLHGVIAAVDDVAAAAAAAVVVVVAAAVAGGSPGRMTSRRKTSGETEQE